MLGKKLGVDLGSGTVRVIVRGDPAVTAEPSVVGRRSGGGFAGAGLSAAAVAAEDPAFELIRPLAGGAAPDPGAVTVLLQHVINRAAGRQRIFRPDLVIALAPMLSDDTRRHVLDICARLGARTTYLIDTPLAATMGAGLSLSSGRGHLLIDIGSGTVEVAVIAHEGTIASRSSASGGDVLRAVIAQRIAELHRLHIAEPEAEEVVASLACAATHEERRMRVRGSRDGVEAEESVASTELTEAVSDHVRRLAEAVEEVLAETPPALRADISAEGITVCGGGARVEGLDRALAAATGETVRIAPDPQGAVLRGTAAALENLDVLKRSFMYIR
jgi:rod shape-determining protein MreB